MDSGGQEALNPWNGSSQGHVGGMLTVSVTQALCSGLFLSMRNSNMFTSQEKWPIERERFKI